MPLEAFEKLRSVLSDPSSWIDVGGHETEIETTRPSPEADLTLVEVDLQKFLSRNLGAIEKGLTPDPEYELREYKSDVGRLDFLCRDARGNWVVVELKVGRAGDDAIGQILGYMSWVRDNLSNGSTVRGILVSRDATDRAKAAIKLTPALSMKRFTFNFSIDDMP